MKNLSGINLYVALMHYPVVNKNGETIASAVTNLDLHDIARASKTYGVKAYYVVTPLSDQQDLVKKIAGHWLEGSGGTYNPKRGEALDLIRLTSSLDEVKNDIRRHEGVSPEVVVTCAQKNERSTGYEKMREVLTDGHPRILTFGTAWGLTREFKDAADYILDPIAGNTGYNHLSVRSAVSIILDRLTGAYT